MKISTLIEEGSRRLPFPSLLQTEQTDLMQEFNCRMVKAGYTEQFRYRVTKNSYRKYNELLKKERNGERKLYRSKSEIIARRVSKRTENSQAGWLRR